MKHSLRALPNFFTLSNLFFGFIAILLSFNDNFIMATWCVILSAVCDDLDGRIARWTKSFSEFGKELDSIVDAVSFGVAPAFIVYNSSFREAGPWGIIFCFMFVLACVFRLARFNVITTGFKKGIYKGMPAPVAAITVTSLLFFLDHYWGTTDGKIYYLYLLPLTTFFMVSNVSFEPIPMPRMNRSLKKNLNSLLYLSGMIMVIFFPKQAFFPWSILYLTKNLVTHLMFSKKRKEEPEINIDDDNIIK